MWAHAYSLERSDQPRFFDATKSGPDFLVGVSGYLLVTLWSWGGNQMGEVEYWWDFLDSIIRIIEIVVKIVLSFVIVSFAFLIGMLIVVLRQRNSEATAGVKQPSQRKAIRNRLLITSSIGMVLGTMMVVLIVVRLVWLIWEFVWGVLNLPLLIALLVL